MDRFLNLTWRKIPDYARPILLLSALTLGLIWAMYSRLNYTSYTKPCKDFGELFNVNAKLVGTTCYVEYQPGLWVERFYFEHYQKKGFGDP